MSSIYRSTESWIFHSANFPMRVRRVELEKAIHFKQPHRQVRSWGPNRGNGERSLVGKRKRTMER